MIMFKTMCLIIHRIHKWWTRGKKLVPSHESEVLEDKQELQMKTFSDLAIEYIPSISWKCLFEVWLFDKGRMDNKIAMIAMCRRIFRKNVPSSNAQQSCITSLNLCSRFVAHIPIRVFEECTLQ